MPTLPISELIGFGTQVRAYLDNYKTQLIAKGFDPTTVIGQINADEDDLTDADQTQESLKTQLGDQTKLVEKDSLALYDKCSTTLDAALGLLGKTTAEGKEGARIRSNLDGREIEDVIGFTQQLRAFLSHYSAQLIAAGYDPAPIVAELETEAETLAATNETQEALKTQLGKQTKTVEAKQAALYKKISSTLDAGAGLLGKKSAEGKEGLAIRSNLLASGASPPPPPSPPSPPSPPPPSPSP